MIFSRTQAQSDSDLDSRGDRRNSATEISTDSEFEHDQITLDPPKIFIDDTHLRRPTKVQVRHVCPTSVLAFLIVLELPKTLEIYSKSNMAVNEP